MAAAEVTAPMVPVVVNGLRFRAKPEAVVVPETKKHKVNTSAR